MFLNFSNHSSDHWGEDELAAAKQWGEILDMPFPNVAPESDKDTVAALARDYVRRILAMGPDVVLCMGEMTLCFRVAQGLLNAGIPVVAACSERVVTLSGNLRTEAIRSYPYSASVASALTACPAQLKRRIVSADRGWGRVL